MGLIGNWKSLAFASLASAAALAFIGAAAVAGPLAAERCKVSDPQNSSQALNLATLKDCDLAIAKAGDDRVRLLYSRALIRRELNMLDESLEDLNEVAASLPDNAQVLRMRAWTYRTMSRLEEAERDLTQSLALDDFWQGYLSRCVVRLDLKRPESALPDCRMALRRREMEDSVFFTAQALLSLDRLDEASKVIERGLSRGHHSSRLYAMLVDAYRDLGNGPRAAEARRRGLELFPDDKELKARAR